MADPVALVTNNLPSTPRVGEKVCKLSSTVGYVDNRTTADFRIGVLDNMILCNISAYSLTLCRCVLELTDETNNLCCHEHLFSSKDDETCILKSLWILKSLCFFWQTLL